MSSSSNLRLAAPADAGAIAAVKIASWRWAYAGLLPHVLLEALDPATEEAEWRTYLEEMPPDDRLWVALHRGIIKGFARTGPGEVHGLYVAPDCLRAGLGRRLFTQAVADLTERGFAPVVLWHFVGNDRAAAFYERAGFPLDGVTRRSDFGVDEVRRSGPAA
ncbi:MAG TPA: GNAT family N-acetyltransferase [Gaiellaceae bacterium]|nr:GNAT family N-acetyltransferase [Gaiellaceae bacterium]